MTLIVFVNYIKKKKLDFSYYLKGIFKYKKIIFKQSEKIFKEFVKKIS